MINFIILSGAAITAYLLAKLFEFIDRKLSLMAYYRGKFYKKKIQKLHDNAFYYYYDLMQTRPQDLAYDLASRDIRRLKKEGKIDILYRKLGNE